MGIHRSFTPHGSWQSSEARHTNPRLRLCTAGPLCDLAVEGSDRPAQRAIVNAVRTGNPVSNLKRYERIAPLYDLLDFPFEHFRYRRLRPLLFRGLAGRLLDAGVGTGRNFPFYPPDAQVVGVDFSPGMLARAEQRRRSATAPVELLQMDVTQLNFPDRFFDGAVATFLFCTLPDELQVPALQELARSSRAEPSDSSNTHGRVGRFGAPSPDNGNHGYVGPMGRASIGEPRSMCRKPDSNWSTAALSSPT
jgi:SAM-dependent methyltransferase